MRITKHSYSDELVKNVRDQIASSIPAKTEQPQAQLLKIASGNIGCPLAGKDVDCSSCNLCKHASGTSVQNGEKFIKCAYADTAGMVKTASRSQADWNEFFTTADGSDYNAAQSERVAQIRSELDWAAKHAGIEVSDEQSGSFIKTAINEHLTGKNLERAARKFIQDNCAERAFETPSKYNEQLDSAKLRVISTTSSPDAEGADNNSKTSGAYMGMLRNPNSIWDSEALTRLAQKKTSDEKMLEEKAKIQESKEQDKKAQWQEHQDKLSDELLLTSSKIHSAHADQSHSPNTPATDMSMFDQNRDFEGIPEKTAGETLHQDAQKRAEKKTESKPEWQKLAKPKTADHTLNSLFIDANNG